VQGFDHALGRLVSIDGSTATPTLVASFGPNSIKSLAFDAASNVLYGVDVATDQLVVLDVAGGAVVAVGPIGFGRVQGLAFDPNARVLYGVDRDTAQLITIDTTTGAGTAVGPLGFTGARSLAFDSYTDTLYGTAGSQGQILCRINKSTGAATQHVHLAVPVDGLAYDPAANLLYFVDTGTGTLFYLGPPYNGVKKKVGTIGFQEDAGIVHVFERTFPAPTPYCTAGTSSAGCQALLAASGMASASSPNGFVLTTVGVEGSKNGLFFFGTNGRQANPWGNGTSYQCVVPPVKRAGLLPGVGTVGACDGSFTQDLNAHWCPTCPKPAQNPGAGATVQAQLWYRDPANTSNQATSLSDAIEFAVSP
jgi:hypothetical protein